MMNIYQANFRITYTAYIILRLEYYLSVFLYTLRKVNFIITVCLAQYWMLIYGEKIFRT